MSNNINNLSSSEARGILKTLGSIKTGMLKGKVVWYSNYSISVNTKSKMNSILSKAANFNYGADWQSDPKKLSELIKKTAIVLAQQTRDVELENEISSAIDGLHIIKQEQYKENKAFQNFVEKAIDDLNDAAQILRNPVISTEQIETEIHEFEENSDIADSDSASVGSHSSSLEEIIELQESVVENTISENEEVQVPEVKDFASSYPDLEAEAIKRHDLFKFLYVKESPITIDGKSGVITSTADQLMGALVIARNTFADYLNLAGTPEQRVQASRLVQLIMLGKEGIADASLPKNQFCLAVRDLKLSSFEITESIPAGKSYLFHSLEKLEKKPLKTNFQSCVYSFLKDCIQRSSWHIQMNNTFDAFVSEQEPQEITVRTGIASQQKGRQPQFFDMIAARYTDYLLNHPDAARKIIEKNKQSFLFQKAREYFSSSEENASSSFSEQTLKKIMEVGMESWIAKENGISEDGQLMIGQQEQIFRAARLSDDVIQYIQESMRNIGFSAEVSDIEPLVRMKMFELMIILNQSTLAPATVQLSTLLMETLSLVLIPSGKKYIFHFEEDSFESFTNTNDFIMWSPEKDRFYEDEKITEIHPQALELFAIRTRFDVPITNEDDPIIPPEYNLSDQVLFSYQTPCQIIALLSKN